MNLWEVQDQLQADARIVMKDLALDELNNIGKLVITGSYTLGLMVQKDIDILVICDSLADSASEIMAIGVQFFQHPRIRVVIMRDDTGSWNEDIAQYPDGLFLGLKYRTPNGEDWNLDIWFVDEPERQPCLQHIKTIPPRINDQIKQAILTIKHAWKDSSAYGSQVKSYDIYSAVLDYGVRTPEDFLTWLDNMGFL